MRRAMFTTSVLALSLAFSQGIALPATSQDANPVEGLSRQDGLVGVYADAEKGRILIELDAPGPDGVIGDYIYTEYLRSGLGSNPVGLDRSQGGGSQLIRFRRLGESIVIEAMNTRYIASADNPLEKQAVRDSFATSILWAGKIAGRGDGDSVIVDLSSFLTRDSHGVARRLDRAGQGKFQLAKDRSFVDVGATLVFPDNIELEAILTFSSSAPGSEIRATTPDAGSVTLRTHHSFVRLPDDGYQIRWADQRTAAIGRPVQDYSAGLAEPLLRHMASRHRLERVDPSAESGPVKEPIVYYVDSGAPEPVKSALVEGAGWWAEAYEAAGFEGGYRVEVLPDGAHPLDIRYNIINWVHRQTRGWSYGGSVSDPRTGEILKGNVLLGSLRVRQDRMILEGLVGVAQSGSGGDNDPIQVALSRIRQLSAHEVGHTLGFAHNMSASSYGRASVMDYPAPLIGITDDGRLDLSGAYDVGIGDWDKFTVQWLYSEFAPGTNEPAALNSMVDEALGAGMIYISDGDSRALGTPDPRGALWDNGSDAVDELRRTMRIRAIALDDFGLGNIREGAPLSDLRAVLVPIYLFHRYQAEAAVKALGGMHFGYGLKGDSIPVATPLPAEYQLQALEALLDTIEPAALDLSDDILRLLTPQHRDQGDLSRELFTSNAGAIFDLMAAVDAAAGMTIGNLLLHPARATRLVERHRSDPSMPGLEDVLGRMADRIFDAPSGGRQAEIGRVVQARYVAELIRLAADPATPHLVRLRVDGHLRGLDDDLRGGWFSSDEGVGADHRRALRARIVAHLSRASEPVDPAATITASPPGSPIGNGSAETCWHCDTGWPQK